jgi:phenylpropionate dioxygenase-like ring-hydroxylating dioxygenase large terminal subunit
MQSLNQRNLVIDQVDQGIFEVNRDVFRDEEVFSWEMQYIFEGSWIYLAHESLLPNPHDFYTTMMGRQPVVLMRDAKGLIHGFLNACPHRGALITHFEQGNKKYHRCEYHGWMFDSNGACISVRDEEKGCYAQPFSEKDHNLVPIAKFGNYRGFLFGSLNYDVPDFDEWLGDVKVLLDLVVDQGKDGVELLPGAIQYTFDANWKLQLENCPDAYHLQGAHPSFMTLVSRRKRQESGYDPKAIDFQQMFAGESYTGGSWTFPYGHVLVWAENPQKSDRPLFAAYDELKKRVGLKKAEWMLHTRNLTVFPNVQFAENASLLLRIMRPLAVDKTEMLTFCVAPKNEDPKARMLRLRQYEDFFNPSGLATPDDTTCYEDCQLGYKAYQVQWQQGYDRGIAALQKEADTYAKELGINPLTAVVGPFAIQDETVFHGGYREWQRLIEKGLAKRKEN